MSVSQLSMLAAGPTHRGQRTNISHSETVGREGGTRFLEPNLAFAYFDTYIKFLNKENMHTYSYGVLLYSDGRMPPLVALFADLYQFCTRYVKSNNDLCSADVLTWRVLRAIDSQHIRRA